jgi:enoyl-CoA hydratase/carnithine racemase
MTDIPLQTSPPKTSFAIISYPAPGILIITLNRPKSLNCINTAGHWELDEVLNWFDNEPGLNVAIMTGSGRAFCAGADLKGLFLSTLK